MHFLIRTITGRALGEALESEYQGDKLTVGSGGNNTLQLTGLAGQLKFKPVQVAGRNGSAKFSAKGARVLIGGKPTRGAIVAIGDQLTLPGYVLEVIPPPQGFQFALQIAAEGVSYTDGTELGERAWSMRRASWIGALLVLALCLLLPALVLFSPENAVQLRQSPLPDDGLWSSGPLDSAHTTAGVAKDCQVCHKAPFVMVQDTACLDCHRTINEHVDIGVHKADEFTGTRCASCHREHNEPARLVRNDNGLCVDCHTTPERWEEGAVGMEAVTAFTAGSHPQFRLDLLTPLGPGGAHGWDIEQARQGDAQLRERSNLKFNHMVHLNGEKVKHESTGEALACVSCHILEADREHFKPITMDNQCRSCHKLNFDMFEPDLELPHGDLRAAIVAMEAHFIREFTDPSLRRDRAATTPRRVPGKRESAASCDPTRSGLDCGRAEALKEAQFQFAETGCVTCHKVTDTGLNDIHDRWFVQPIRINGDWFRESRFDHVSHLSHPSDIADEACLSCHKAKTSEDATDILIPGQDNCLQCHDQESSEMPVNCVSCHVFHTPSGSSSILIRGAGSGMPPPASMSGQGE